MKSFLCCFVMGAGVVSGAVGGGQAAPFAVYTRFDHAPSAVVQASLAKELTSIMASVGLPVEWRSLAYRPKDEGFVELAVVTFKGTCDCTSLIPQSTDGPALAWTFATGGGLLPFSEVDCDRTRSVISRALMPLSLQERDEAFGRALARIAAHELAYVFTAPGHSVSAEFGKTAYSVPQLISTDFRFGRDEARGLTMTALLVAHPARGSRNEPALVGQSIFVATGCARCHGADAEGSSRGPKLRAVTGGRPLGAGQLNVRLKNTSSEMYRRARDMGIEWRTLSKADIESVVGYLNSAID